VELIADFKFPVPGRPGLVLDEDKISEIAALKAGVAYRKIDPLKLDMQLISRTFSRPYAARRAVLPLEKSDGALVVAVANPFDGELFDQLRAVVGHDVRPVLSSKADILRSIEHVYGFRKSVDAAADANAAVVEISNFEQLVRLSTDKELDATDKPVISAVEYLLRYAFDQRASDIHIEPKREESLVRMRIDGVLHPVHTLPRNVHGPIVARIKMLSRMDIAEKRRPQDGRIKTDRNGREVELRVSTIPTAFGEKVVMRIFDPDTLVQDLSQIGFLPQEQALFESWIARPHGLILVTGPTGSGKTTTLYSALKLLAGPDVNVTTIEDPIEMIHEGFNQIQVQPKIELDFAGALRHILRQDPDIIMVGEIRDRETAQNAIQAALTGHLVLSTLHTNNAADAVTRLIDLGVEPFLVATSLVGIMAQRLVRLVCNHCAVEANLTADQVAGLGVFLPLVNGGGFRRGEGCPKCRNTGYSGRSGVFEMLDVNEDIKQLILKRADAGEVATTGRRFGMRSLREAGVLKLAMGLTTFDEVVRVT
ncbi:MAG: GspE/PulE family protein, partial [Myxococcales bacterium]